MNFDDELCVLQHACQISCRLDVIYYSIQELVFCLNKNDRDNLKQY